MKGSSVNPGSGPASSTSTSLIDRLRARDGGAWVVFSNVYGPLVYGWCRRRGLQASDAADVVQEVFRAVAQNIKGFHLHPDGSFRGWLWTITRTKLLDHFRRAERRPEAKGGSDAQQRMAEIPETLEESDAESSGTGALVRRALETILPEFEEATRQAFWRVMMEGQAPAHVAESLGITVNAVYIAKSRVLRRLRDQLGDDCL